jgi:hypothetical protein
MGTPVGVPGLAWSPGRVKVRDALGLGSAEGRTVIPVSVWLPLAVALLVVAGLLAAAMDGSGGLVLGFAAVAAALVIPVATVFTARRDRRKP